MRSLLLSFFVSILFVAPFVSLAQSAPNLRSTSSFAAFTAVGAFSNVGASTVVTGDVGTNVGAFSAFPPGVLNGQIHVANPISVQAATDVDLAYGEMSTITCGSVISTTMGGGQTLLPGVYCPGAASTIGGDLILDGQGDPSSLFIFKIGGALATTVDSRIILTNGASICNVYWQVNGQVDLGENSIFQGTLVVNGAINLLEGATLYGRALSRQGAISLHNNTITISSQPTASVIAADGLLTLCAGESVILSGNVGGTWSNGLTTASITVKTSGDYFVTNTNGCGTVTSNHIAVTVNPLPVCSITGNNVLCAGVPATFTATGGTTYSWTGPGGFTANTATINNLTVAGSYSVTVSANGCQSTCSRDLVLKPIPVCNITGNNTICAGGSATFTVPAGTSGTTYLWTGPGGFTATTNTIRNLTTPGTYTVTINDGCVSTCSRELIVSNTLVCNITGNNVLCGGGSATFTATGGTTYSWTGPGGFTASTATISNLTVAGIYSVIVSAGGCQSTCSRELTVSNTLACNITGNNVLCAGVPASFTATGGTAYSWTGPNGFTANTATINNLTVAGSYSVTVSANGCQSTCSRDLVLKPIPVCNISGNNTICAGGSTTFTVPAGTSGTTYSWTGPGGFTATTNTISNLTMPGTYTVTINDGCVSTCSRVLTVDPLSVCNALPVCKITGNSIICEGASTTFTATGGTTYSWTGPGGFTASTATISNLTVAGNYMVRVRNANGGQSTCSRVLTVNPLALCNALPVCKITGNNIICAGGSATFTATGGTTYSWTGPNGFTASAATISNLTVAGNYMVRVKNASGGQSTCSRVLTVNPLSVCSNLPVCRITGNNIIFAGGSATFTATGGTTYSWTGPGGFTASTATISNLKLAGNYMVRVKNASGGQSTCSRVLTVNPLPVSNSLAVSDMPFSLVDDATMITVVTFPNPFKQDVKFTILSPVSGPAVLHLYNLQGQSLQTMDIGFIKAGQSQEVEYSNPSYSSGLILYDLRVGNKQVKGKLLQIE